MTDRFVRRPNRATPDAGDLTLAAFNTDCSAARLETLAATLGDYLDIEDATAGRTVADDRSAEFAVLHDDVLVEGALVSGDGDDALAAAASPFRPTETLFLAGYESREGLRTLSNRIETRAWRAGEGVLSVAGHQRLAGMDDQWRLYEDIAEAGVTVRVFENAAFVPGDASAFEIRENSHGLAGTWLVAFDGGGNDAAKGALVAAERDPGSYYGVWTVVPELVDELLDRVVGGDPDPSRR